MELIPPNTKIDFVGNRYYAYAFTALMILLSLAAIPIKGGLVLGIDFSGGATIQIRFNKPVETAQVREALEPLSEALSVQKFQMAGEEFIIKTDIPKEGAEGIGEKAKELLEKSIGKGSVEIRGVEMVGPKVGKDLRDSAMWATAIALAFLLIYMAFRFTFVMGLSAVFCLVHDLCILYGFFAWTGKEFNLTILAAFLTVIGYDINDTIVVCDRVRENIKFTKKTPLLEVLNNAVNQTLSRTVLTSTGTLLVVVALLIYGTTVLQDLAWALLVGILFGTYSSIYVAMPVVLVFDRWLPMKRG